MKFSCSVKINCHKAKVAEIFSNPNLLRHFQEGFITKEPLEGEPGEKGAQSKMVYEKMELKETILYNKLPDEFMALYEHKHMTNTMKVRFESISETSTIYTSDIEYTKFNGFIIKIIARLFPGMFKKQVLKWMILFKNYCESN